MPGMMDTVLNLGLNDKTVEGLAKASGNARFAYDSYRRFIMMYSDVVLDVHKDHFEHKIEALKAQDRQEARHRDHRRGVEEVLCGEFKAIVKEKLGQRLPPGSPRAALRRHLRRVQQLGHRARHHLPQA